VKVFLTLGLLSCGAAFNVPVQKNSKLILKDAVTRDPTPRKDADSRKSITSAPSFEEYMRSRGMASSSVSKPASAAAPKAEEGVTRNPAPKVDPSDSRKSITAAPSFEEYMRSRQGGSAAASAKVAVAETKTEVSKKSSSMFEDYMKSRQGGSSAAAPAPAKPAPAASAKKGSMFEEYMNSRNGGTTASVSAEKKVEGVTRDPAPKVDKSDSRKSITAAPSFEEYMRSRGMGK